MIGIETINRRTIVFLLLLLLTRISVAWADENGVQIGVFPEQPFVEVGEHSQNVSCDFLLKNESGEKLTIEEIIIHAFDDMGGLISRRMVDTNGFNPSINTLGISAMGAGESLFVYNPFSRFDPGFTIGEMHYTFGFKSEIGEAVVADVVVRPEYYETKTALILPVKDRVIVYDGHCFYSHHRRLDLTHPILKQIGITANPSRYAYDLCVVNNEGELFENGGEHNEDWFGYGAEVRSPAAGTVVELFNDMPDNILGSKMFDFGQVMENPRSMAGNYVIIDHQNGEFSMLGHFRQGSIEVKEGDAVRQGQLIGRLGFSGSTADWVHLHYELRNGQEMWSSEGLPSYFGGFDRVLGSKAVAQDMGLINTGDIVESQD